MGDTDEVVVFLLEETKEKMPEFIDAVHGSPNALVPVRRALLSVFDKTGIEDLAEFLFSRGVAILSTGGTAKTLISCGIKASPDVNRIARRRARKDKKYYNCRHRNKGAA